MRHNRRMPASAYSVSSQRGNGRLLACGALVLAWALSGSIVSAQTFVEYQHIFGEGPAYPTLDAQIEIPQGPVNFYGWFLASDGWGEGEVGVSKLIRPWFWAAVAAGIETDESPARINIPMWIAKGRFFTFFVNEYGGSGYWYKVTSTALIAPRTEVGVISQTDYGTGPLVQLSLGRGFRFWGSFVEGPKSLVGILRTF